MLERKNRERRRLQLKSLDMLISFQQQKSIVGGRGSLVIFSNPPVKNNLHTLPEHCLSHNSAMSNFVNQQQSI